MTDSAQDGEGVTPIVGHRLWGRCLSAALGEGDVKERIASPRELRVAWAALDGAELDALEGLGARISELPH